MAPIPGAFDPSGNSPHPTAGLFGLGLGSQVGAAIPNLLSLRFGCCHTTSKGRRRPDGRASAVPNKIGSMVSIRATMGSGMAVLVGSSIGFLSTLMPNTPQGCRSG
jgi:hypothetical protein